MKKCPVCELNYIRDDEECCAICAREKEPVNVNFKRPGQAVVYKAIKNSDVTYTPIIDSAPAPRQKLEDCFNKTIYVSTHAEFLNRVFGTSYDRWMKATWNYSSNVMVWMVRFYGNTGDWINRFKDGDTITEQYTGNLKLVETPTQQYRIVVAIEDRYGSRSYTIKGIFKISQEDSTDKFRIYKRVDLDI